MYANERAGQFQVRAVPQELGKSWRWRWRMNSDSVLDIVVLQADGNIQRLSQTAAGEVWHLVRLAQWPAFPSEIAAGYRAPAGGGYRQQWCLGPDRSPTGGRVWLSDVQGDFQALATPCPDAYSPSQS